MVVAVVVVVARVLGVAQTVDYNTKRKSNNRGCGRVTEAQITDWLFKEGGRKRVYVKGRARARE